MTPDELLTVKAALAAFLLADWLQISPIPLFPHGAAFGGGHYSLAVPILQEWLTAAAVTVFILAIYGRLTGISSAHILLEAPVSSSQGNSDDGANTPARFLPVAPAPLREFLLRGTEADEVRLIRQNAAASAAAGDSAPVDLDAALLRWRAVSEARRRRIAQRHQQQQAAAAAELRGSSGNDVRHALRDWNWRQPRILRALSVVFGTGWRIGLSISEFNVAVAMADGEVLEERCIVCYGQFQHGELLSWHRCLHVLHDECLLAWHDRQTGRTCPVCRSPSQELWSQRIGAGGKLLRFVPSPLQLDCGLVGMELHDQMQGITQRPKLALLHMREGFDRSVLKGIIFAFLAVLWSVGMLVEIVLSIIVIFPFSLLPPLILVHTLLVGHFATFFVVIAAFFLRNVAFVLLLVLTELLIKKPLASRDALFDFHRVMSSFARRTCIVFNDLVEAEGRAQLPTVFRSVLPPSVHARIEDWLKLRYLPSEVARFANRYAEECDAQNAVGERSLADGDFPAAAVAFQQAINGRTFFALSRLLKPRSDIHIQDVAMLEAGFERFKNSALTAGCNLARALDRIEASEPVLRHMITILSELSLLDQGSIEPLCWRAVLLAQLGQLQDAWNAIDTVDRSIAGERPCMLDTALQRLRERTWPYTPPVLVAPGSARAVYMQLAQREEQEKRDRKAAGNQSSEPGSGRAMSNELP